jgi:hypothetical protein
MPAGARITSSGVSVGTYRAASAMNVRFSAERSSSAMPARQCVRIIRQVPGQLTVS